MPLAISYGEIKMPDALLEIKNLVREFKVGGILFGIKFKAVENVNLLFEREKPKILTIAGESGSGKTTLIKIILGLVKPTKGKVLYRNKDIFTLKGEDKKIFMKNIQPIFQNPYESFNPLKKIDRYLMDTAINYKVARNREEATKVVSKVLETVSLGFEEIKEKYPHEISGGQLQRASIGRALITNPNLLIADEPVSMIDASLRINILNIFLELKKMKTSVLYVTHDLATASYISDEIAIMIRGNIVEKGYTSDVLSNPLHPYTKMLVECIPKPDPRKRWKEQIKLSSLEIKEFGILGCKFADRCPNSNENCFKKSPPEMIVNGHAVKCWIYK